jgi:beta-mannosidase
VACNDTRRDLEIQYSVRDVDTSQVLASGLARAGANASTTLSSIPFFNSEKRFYFIEWKSEIGTGRNHYLAGHPAFDLETYRGWLAKVELLPSL